MENPTYNLDHTKTFMTFEFISEGPKGKIIKLVKYTLIDDRGIYNLGFGDKMGENDDFDDEVNSDNKDTLKVLATVAKTVILFSEKYPRAAIFASGSTPARNRLYRMGISIFLTEIEEYFKILGKTADNWERFEKNGNYSAYLLLRKSI